MRILMLTHSFNSLSQRLYAELVTAGHELSVELDISDSVTLDAVRLWGPDVILAPFLKRRIPESVWRKHLCLIVHPGPPGDRGPAALDWAILRSEPRWGVTVLQANDELDGGPVWAWREFAMRAARKSSLYRQEVTEATVEAVCEALARVEFGGFSPPPESECAAGVRGHPQPRLTQKDRRLDWQQDDTRTLLQKLYSGDGSPGVEDELAGRRVRMFDARAEPDLRGEPGRLIARSEDAVCLGTRDGAIWIGQLRPVVSGKSSFKLPATQVLGERIRDLPAAPARIDAFGVADTREGLCYLERGAVGYLYFDFYNGAMGTAQCERLRDAYGRARARPTRALVLMGGEDFWSNGLDLNRIEAAASPADESWRNICAMDDLVRDILTTDDHLTIAALRGNAGAGGVFLALAADLVYARQGVILNPHYKNMGNLYGSEYWTYLLPKRMDEAHRQTVVTQRLPLGAMQAAGLGLVDECLAAEPAAFETALAARAAALVTDPRFAHRLAAKREARARDEANHPLATYREQELRHMQLNFYGFDPSYHVARYKFVHRTPHAWTPLYLARHRQLGQRHARATS